MIMYIENGDFVGIVNGIPYSSESKTNNKDLLKAKADHIIATEYYEEEF